MGTLVFQATLGGAVNIIGPNIASTINFTLPSADGTSGQTWTTNGSGLLTFGTLGIAGGGTGQITATAAFNALAPSQSGQSGKYLTTDGTNTSWGTNPLGTVTSVAATVPSFLSIAGSPITTSGTLAFTLSGTALPTTSGGTGLTSFTSGGVVYASSSSALATGSALTFNGTNEFKVLAATGVAYNRTESTQYSTFAQHFAASGNTGVEYKTAYRFVDTDVGEIGRFTSTGLGIGTSSPSQKLHVAGNILASGANPNYYAKADNSGIASFYTQNAAGVDHWRIFSAMGSAGEQNNLVIRNVVGASNVFNLDTSGNLGLGVTPSAWSGGGGFDLPTYAGIAGNSSVGFVASFNAYYNSGWKYKATAAARAYVMDLADHHWYNAPSGTAGNAISFTQAMTLDASGNLLVGTTSSPLYASRSYFVGTASVGGLAVSAPGDSSGYPVYFVDSNATSATQQLVHFERGTTYVGSINTTNTATSYSTSSDYRLKNTIAPITGALAKVALLKPCTYKWNIDGSASEGFIAHELAEVCPIAVHGTKDAIDADGKPDYQSVDTSFLVATLTAAIQELDAKFEAYKASHP